MRADRGGAAPPGSCVEGSLDDTAALSVARTRAGVIGASRMRTPVASKNAFAIAAGTGQVGGSPEPVGGRSVRWTIFV